MANAQNILNALQGQGISVAVHGNNLRVEFKQHPSPEALPLLPELKRFKGEVIALLKTIPEAIEGHSVSRIIWKTDKAIIFEDKQGHYWRYLHNYGQCWPVVIRGGNKESD